MFRLAFALFSLISTTLMGIGVIAVLAAGYDTLNPILIAAGAGFVVSVPVSWFVARAVYNA